MRKIVWMIAVITMLAGGQVVAADKWLKKKDPEELYAYIDAQDCPITSAEITDIVHAQLIRSRIKPLTKWDSGQVVLYVALDCALDDGETWLFELTTMLAKLKSEGRNNVAVSFRHEDQFDSFGKGSVSTITKTLERAVEDAFMKYLNANFDLEPGAPD